jgi:hypothetical protein
MKPWGWVIGILAGVGVLFYLSSQGGAGFTDLGNVGDDSEVPGGGAASAIASSLSSGLSSLTSLFSGGGSTDYSAVTP